MGQIRCGLLPPKLRKAWAASSGSSADLCQAEAKTIRAAAFLHLQRVPSAQRTSPATAAGLAGAPSLRQLPLSFMNISLTVKYILCLRETGRSGDKGK